MEHLDQFEQSIAGVSHVDATIQTVAAETSIENSLRVLIGCIASVMIATGSPSAAKLARVLLARCNDLIAAVLANAGSPCE